MASRDRSWSKAAPMGPWYEEPDTADFEHAGLWCHIERRPGLWLCGYVAVPPSHVAYGKGYDGGAVDGVSVHRGLTFAGPTAPGCERAGLWWFGFHCAHAGDFVPKSGNFWGEYRTWAWVEAETRRLAEQLAAMFGSHPTN